MAEVTSIDVAIDNIGDAIREIVRMEDTAGLEEELRGVYEFLQRLKEFARDKRELEEFLR